MPDLGFVPAQRPASAADALVLATSVVGGAVTRPGASAAAGSVPAPATASTGTSAGTSAGAPAGAPAAEPVVTATSAPAAAAAALAASAPTVSGEVLAFRPSPLAAPAVLDRGASDAARAEGFATGYAAGAREAARVAQEEATRVRLAQEERRVAAQVALDRALDVLRAAGAAAAARTVPVATEVEHRLHAAALDLATAVLGVELSDHERGARAALARVLAHVDGTEPVTVRLHPADLAALTAAADATGATLPDVPEGVTLVADATLAPGDARADLPDGFLDARVDAALARARAALDGAA
ncbi:FliH/SctL family protein [Cellulomonas biazotea]|uniref:FliH/SctL family protein n=2 Tax=Cellulomonas biazotea TaxID=1709 RepID=UPI0035EBD040